MTLESAKETPHVVDPNIRRLARAEIDLPDSIGETGSKRQILCQSLKLFAERNFSGASVRDIAEACGLKPASLYAHYKSKEEILATLIVAGHKVHMDAIDRAVSGVTASREALIAWVDAHVRFHGEYPMLATVINHELHALPADRIKGALQYREDAIDRLLKILALGEENGEFRCGADHWLTAASLGAMGMRVAHWYTGEAENKYSLDEVSETYQKFALRIVRAG